MDFIASNPTTEEIAAFGPTPEMKNRLKQLLDRNLAGDLTSWEQQELAELVNNKYLNQWTKKLIIMETFSILLRAILKN